MNRLTLHQAITAALFQKWFQWQFSSRAGLSGLKAVRVCLSLVSVLSTVPTGSWSGGLWSWWACLALTWGGFFRVQRRWLCEVTDFQMPSPSARLALWEHCGGSGTFPGMGQAHFYLLGTKTSILKKTFLATRGTWYQSNTSWLFDHFSCGFSNVVAILLW